MSPSTSTLFFFLLASLAVLVIAGTEPLIDTKEYQLTLEENDFEGIGKRADTIDKYLDVIRQNIDLDDDFETEIDLRNEGRYDVDNCGIYKSTFVRIRSWFRGDNAGLRSLDIKNGASGETRSEALDAPLAPRDKYADQADQDVEEDIHTCYRDYARTTKVFFEDGSNDGDEIATFNTCGDLREFFPDAFDNDNDDEEISTGFDTERTTYIYRVRGTMPSGSAIEFTFNLEYDSPEDAEDADNINSGEFSITYMAQGGGFDGFDSSELDDVEDLYRALFEEFGSPKDDPCSSGEGINISNSNNDDDDNNSNSNNSNSNNSNSNNSNSNNSNSNNSNSNNSNSNNSNSNNSNSNNDDNDSSDAVSVIPSLMIIFLVSFVLLF